jgi:predicted esterase
MSGDVTGTHFTWRPATRAGLPTLLLLHGTGGTEHDLLPLAADLLPGAACLAPRGAVLEHGMPRFFRRLAEGVFDQDDLLIRTEELADFIRGSATREGFDPARVVAIGFSNGANIAASLLLRGRYPLKGAILLRPMLPFEPTVPPDLPGTRVLISAGSLDPMVTRPQVEGLQAALARGGAEVTLDWQQAGHGLLAADVEVARRWLAGGVAA